MLDNMIKKYFNSLFTIVFIGMITNISNAQNLLKKALASDNDKIKKVMDNPEAYELQIIYTQIIRGKNNTITLKDYTYNLNKNNYFYPASTVKFPIAVMALEKLNSIPNTSDSEKNIEFMVSATLLVNKDGIFNDNVYEYDEVGLPFLAELGRQLYLLNDKVN